MNCIIMVKGDNQQFSIGPFTTEQRALQYLDTIAPCGFEFTVLQLRKPNWVSNGPMYKESA